MMNCQTGSTRNERGSVLILVLVLTTLVLLLGTSLMSTTDVEYSASKSNHDASVALADADSGVAEVIWRLNVTPGAGAPPTGSTISVNSLANYDASLPYDPASWLENDVDDDVDGSIDEADELNYNRNWSVKILLSTTDPTGDVIDTDPSAGPPYGSSLIIPTIQPLASWKEYTTTDASDVEVLTVRFKKDAGTDQIVFYDPLLLTNGVEDKNTLTWLDGNGNPADDSPYNITHTSGGVKYEATGGPVLIVTATARVRRAGIVVGTRTINTEVAYPMIGSLGFAVCGCTSALGIGRTDSFSRSVGTYSAGPVNNNGDVGSNGNLNCGTIGGNAIAGGNITGANGVARNATAGGTISGAPGMTKWENYSPPPMPCNCDELDVDALIDFYSDPANNDNATLGAGAGCPGPVLGECDLPCGTYFYTDIELNGNRQINTDPPRDPSCVVTIYTTGGMDFSGTMDINRDGYAASMRIISNSTGTALDIGGNATFTGVLYAPKAHCAMNGTPDVYGAILCKTTGVGSVHYDEDLGDLWRYPGRFKVMSWMEVQQ